MFVFPPLRYQIPNPRREVPGSLPSTASSPWRQRATFPPHTDLLVHTLSPLLDVSLPSAGPPGTSHCAVSILPTRVTELTELAEEMLREHWTQFCSSPARKRGLQRCNLPTAPAHSGRQASGHCSHQAPLLSLLGCSAAQKPKQGTRCHRDVPELLPGADPVLPAQRRIRKHRMGHWNQPQYKYLHHRNGQTLQLGARQHREPLLSLY